MYGDNNFVFCTGKKGGPGEFWRFPIHTRYLHHVKMLVRYSTSYFTEEQECLVKLISARSTFGEAICNVSVADAT